MTEGYDTDTDRRTCFACDDPIEDDDLVVSLELLRGRDAHPGGVVESQMLIHEECFKDAF